MQQEFNHPKSKTTSRTAPQMSQTTQLNFDINEQQETIRFSSYDLQSQRAIYEIEQTYGLDEQGNITSTSPFKSFSEGSAEYALMAFIASADVDELNKKDLRIIENPGKDEISRNLCIYEPATNTAYTIGGIGLVRLEEGSKQLFLENPLLDNSFHKYQIDRGNNEGGTVYFTNHGKIAKNNNTPVGVAYYDQGEYNLTDKIQKTEELRQKGFNTPCYVAAGRINNLGNGEFGFSIYKTQLTPDYLLNLGVYLDKSINFKVSYFQYIDAKYKQLSRLHRELSLTHGQPTITNAIAELSLVSGSFSVGCVIKDLATLKAIPTQTKKTITESPCPQDLNAQVKKSPKVAAIVNDLQVAFTQEFNILLIAISALPNDQIKLKFLSYQYPILMNAICIAYGLLDKAQTNQLVTFTLNHFLKSLKLGHSLGSCNEILGGLSAHAMLGLSTEFNEEIEFCSK